MSKVILHVLGTAQDAGLPSPNCFCENCSRAIEDPAFKRQASALAIVLPERKAWHLIDATPDFKEQVAQLQMKYHLEGRMMKSIYLTHAHIGHYTGLMFLGKEAMNTARLPVFAGIGMQGFLQKEAPWRQLVELNNVELRTLEDGKTSGQESDFRITPVEVPHRNEFSETFGFWIKGASKRILYIPDIDRWDEWKLDIATACRNADACLLDGTFFSEEDLTQLGRDFREIPHPVIKETMERLKGVVEETDIYFTHLNHNNPAIQPESEARKFIESRGFKIAEEGMTFEI